jgi:hypothetical protein
MVLSDFLAPAVGNSNFRSERTSPPWCPIISTSDTPSLKRLIEECARSNAGPASIAPMGWALFKTCNLDRHIIRG